MIIGIGPVPHEIYGCEKVRKRNEREEIRRPNTRSGKIFGGSGAGPSAGEGGPLRRPSLRSARGCTSAMEVVALGTGEVRRGGRGVGAVMMRCKVGMSRAALPEPVGSSRTFEACICEHPRRSTSNEKIFMTRTVG